MHPDKKEIDRAIWHCTRPDFLKIKDIYQALVIMINEGHQSPVTPDQIDTIRYIIGYVRRVNPILKSTPIPLTTDQINYIYQLLDNQ